MATLVAPIPHVRALWRPEQYTLVANGTFETNTTGWAATAGINAAGTSITRITTDFHSGAACASVVCTATADSGVNFDFGTQRFYVEATYGTTYAALVWLKRTSGSRQAKITLGSLGTSSDRGTLLITDLPDTWTPYRVMWMPSGTRTDVELAVTNGSAVAVTFKVDDVSVYQVDAFSQVENSNCTVDTTGWSVSAGINGAGTSITQATGDGFAWAGTGGTQTYATLVTTGTSGSGTNYDLGLRKFTSGRTYRARVAMKSVSGTTSARLRLGSLGTGADRGDVSMTITTSWAWYLVDWTASGDRTDVELAISNGTASIMTARISTVEVYEAIDEVNGVGTGVRADVSHMDYSRGIDGTGTLNLVMYDPRDARRYTPWYTSGALYGMLEPGRRVWARATYSDTALYPVSFATIRRIIPDATSGTAQVMCEDPMYDLGRASYSFGFRADYSYATCRGLMFGASAAAADLDPVAGDRRLNLTLAGAESSSFYNGTNGETNALDILEQYNEATGSVHYVAPDARAEVLWRYTTDARQDLTSAASSDETIDDDFYLLSGTDKTDESLENTQTVTWQGYELLPPPETPWPDDPSYAPGYGYVVSAADADLTSTLDEFDPYLHFLRDEYGADDGVPEPSFEREWQWKRKRRKKGGKKVRVRVYNFRRVYEDPFVPFDMAAGDIRQFVIDFSVPVGRVDWQIDGVVDPEPNTVVTVQATPRQAIVTLLANAATTTDFFALSGIPYLPLDEQTEVRMAYDQILDKGQRDGPSLNTPYVASAGDAQGLGDYRNWRYATARMRPTLTVQHRFPSMLQRNPTEHLTVNAALYSMVAKVFVITKMSCSVDSGAKLWTMEYDLEELPSGSALFTLDSSALDGAATLGY